MTENFPLIILKSFLKRGTSYKELQNEIGEPNGELINDEFVYEITRE